MTAPADTPFAIDLTVIHPDRSSDAVGACEAERIRCMRIIQAALADPTRYKTGRQALAAVLEQVERGGWGLPNPTQNGGKSAESDASF